MNDCLGLHVLLSNDPPSDNFPEIVRYREPSALASSSPQEGENEHLCALGNLGHIVYHHSHLDAAKAEEHAGPHQFRTTDRNVDSPIHGTVQPVKDASLYMDLPCDTGRVHGPAVGDLRMDAKATCDCE